MTENGRILVVDDEEIMRDALRALLTSENFDFDLAETGVQALAMMREREYDVVLLDLMMPGMDGLQVLEELKRGDDPPEAIILTAYGTIERAVRATKLGAFDFITKPFKIDELLLSIRNALEHRRLAEENAQLKRSLQQRYSFRNIIGKGAGMQQIFDLIGQVAPTRSTVLIQGESGTGKELAAKAIHAASNRAEAPFVAINCGNIPSDRSKAKSSGTCAGLSRARPTPRKGCSRLRTGARCFSTKWRRFPWKSRRSCCA